MLNISHFRFRNASTNTVQGSQIRLGRLTVVTHKHIAVMYTDNSMRFFATALTQLNRGYGVVNVLANNREILNNNFCCI